MNKSSKRIDYLDIARGIAIILMVIGHIIPKENLYSIISSFHMPLFIIISGYFYKKTNTTELTKKLFKKILLPYIVCLTFVYIIQSIVDKNFNILFLIKFILIGNSKKLVLGIETVGFLWFIPFFIAINIIFNIIKNKIKNDFLLFHIIIILTLIGLILSYQNIYFPWSMDASFACLLFYYTGYILKKYNLLNKLLENKLTPIISLLIYLITINFGYIKIASRLYPYGLICFITAIAGSIIVLYISKIISQKLKTPTKILKWYGKNSIYILLFHYIESNLLNYNFLDSNILLKIILKLTIITTLTFYFFFLKNIKNYFIINNNENYQKETALIQN